MKLPPVQQTHSATPIASQPSATQATPSSPAQQSNAGVGDMPSGPFTSQVRATIPAQTASRAGATLRAAGVLPAFALPPAESVTAIGRVEAFQYPQGSSYASSSVTFTALRDGRIVAENLQGYLNGSEDVVMQEDGHGGYAGRTAGGVWTLTPESQSGARELFFAPSETKDAIVRYTLGVPRPEIELARFAGRTVELAYEPMFIDDDAPQATSMRVGIEVVAGDLVVRVPGGKEHRLSRRGQDAPGPGFASADEAASASYDPRTGAYRLSVDGYTGTLAPEQAERAPARELRAFTEGRNPHAERATLEALATGETMLRFAESFFGRPSVFYFDPETGRGEGADGWTAQLVPAGAAEPQAVLLRSAAVYEQLVRLDGYDAAAEAQQLAGRSGRLTIQAPDGTDRYGHPSRYTTEKTFGVHFGDVLPGSGDRLAVSFEGFGQAGETYTALPTEWGDFYVNVDNDKILIRPNGDGTFKAVAEWSFRDFETGTFELTGSQAKQAE